MSNASSTFHPDARFHVFAAPRCKVALLIGVLNEGDRIRRQLVALQEYRNLVDVIIIDGGSTDGATAPDQLSDKISALIEYAGRPRGLSVQYRLGIAYAIQNGYDAVIMMDGNGKDHPNAIPRFVEALGEGYEFLQGSRFIPGGSHLNTPQNRLLAIRWIFNPLMGLASGFYYSDGINGFKACARSFLENPSLQPLRPIFVRYNLQYYFNYRAPRLCHKIKEVPVSRHYDAPSPNQHHSKIVGFRAWLAILSELMHVLIGGCNP